jgi:hypothetical protein
MFLNHVANSMAVKMRAKAAAEPAEAEAEKATRARFEAERRDKQIGQVVAPRIDPHKPRFEQFFRFVCPFCGYSEEIGLWFTTKTCAHCNKMSRIVR